MNLYYLKKHFLDQSIQKIFYLILKKEALGSTVLTLAPSRQTELQWFKDAFVELSVNSIQEKTKHFNLFVWLPVKVEQLMPLQRSRHGIRTWHAGESCSLTSCGNVASVVSMTRLRWTKLLPVNGTLPTSISNVITPTLHRSALLSYGAPPNTSGACTIQRSNLRWEPVFFVSRVDDRFLLGFSPCILYFVQ